MKSCPKILLVEDEADLAEPVARGLSEEGFNVEIAQNGRAACRKLDEHWDLIILDLMLPDISGEAVLDFFKQKPAYPPTLILSARSRTDDKLSLFRKGCDDYLTKPFSFEELLLRVTALLRRSRREPPENYAYEDLILDPVSYTLKTADHVVTLTPKEAAICRLLLREPGKVISRKEIIQSVWGVAEPPETNPLAVHLTHLKKKLAELGKEHWFRALRASGYSISKPNTEHSWTSN